MVFLCTGIHVPFKGPALPCNPAWSDFFFFLHFVEERKKKRERGGTCIGGRRPLRTIIQEVLCVSDFWNRVLRL